MRERIEELVYYLNSRTDEYNDDDPTISDVEWDNKYFELKRLENETGIILPNSPTQSVHFQTKSSLTKVQHNHPMLSLDKTKDWDTFVSYFNNRDVVGMLKLDGLTCSLCYNNGKLVRAETRGNGIIGEDILHNALVIPSIPKIIDYYSEYIIDGEIICTKQNFEPFANEYANQRNFASGSIRLLSSEECHKRHLTFVAWNVVKGTGASSVIDELTFASNKLGFIVVPWTSSFDLDAKEYLINQAEQFGYPIDGLVGRFDNIAYGESLGSTGHHSRAAYAFKFSDEEYETRLVDVEWSMGRTGVLTPIAVFEPIDDGDTVIERASLHNLTVMKEQLYIPYKGEKIWVYKANQIIPQISKHTWVANDYDPMINMFHTPDICPICGGHTKVVKSDSGTENLVCDNLQCEGKLINQLDHFCGKKGMDIKGLSKATLEKLIDWEWVSSIVDIYHLQEHKHEWIQKPGFGEKSVSNILNAIDNSKNTCLNKFIAAIGIPLVGIHSSKVLCDYIDSYDEFRKKVNCGYHFSELPDFGYQTETAILTFNYEKADQVSRFLNFEEKTPPIEKDFSLNGTVFCITGQLTHFKNRAALIEEIERCGGRVSGSVSAKTNYLIANAVESTAKYKNAIKFNIPIITEQEFIKMEK